jgi:hypothetical protein
VTPQIVVRDLFEVAGAVVALALGVCALLGIFARVVALPWLKTHLLEPVRETNRQVSVNGHTSRDPTLKDSVHTLQKQYTDLRQDIAAAAFMFDGHIAASERDRGDLWRAVGLLRGETIDPTHRKEDPL